MSSPPERNENCVSCDFQEDLEILRQIDFFSGLPMESLKVFAFIGTRETFRVGDYLFRQDDDDGQAFYLIAGSARLLHNDGSGDQLIRTYESGDFLGGLTLLGKLHRQFSLQAVEDTSCLILTRDKFQTTVQQFPEVLPRIVKVVVDRIAAWEERFLVTRSSDCESCRQKVGVSLV
jgi:CRP/FNR family transcriptional regulator, cyclic AMP receptor protein